MEQSILFIILLQIVLIGLNAVFASAEIAVISVNDSKMEKMAGSGDKRAARLLSLTKQPARFLATIQIAITLSGFLGSAFAAENFSGILVDWLLGLGIPVPESVLDSIVVILITLVLSYFTLVFGELVPKQIAMRKAEPLALGISGMLTVIARFFAPLVNFLTFSTNSVLRLCGIDPDAEDENVSEEEIRMMVDAGSEKGTIDHQEREFIQNVFEFDDISAEEILTHRTEVVMLDMEDSMEEWKEIIFRTRHTFYPVCDGSADKIIGILNAKDYFRLENKEREQVMKYAVSSAYFVPDTIKADDLFRNMKKEKTVFAVVLDEYGGVAGIITINDLVEQLVGDLETEKEEEKIEKLEEGLWKIPGSAELEEVSKTLGISLPWDKYETFNGLVFHTLQHIPEQGNNLNLEICGLLIREIEMEENKIKAAVITIKD